MNKNTSVTMAAAIAAILTLAVMTIGLHQAFADDGNNQKCCDPKNQETTKVAVGGNGGSGGAGGAGGEGGAGGTNLVKDQSVNKDVDQDANGGNSNGGHAGNANGGDARTYGNGDDQKASWALPMDDGVNKDHNQKDKQVVCLNTAVNNAGHGFGENGLGSDNLGQSDVPDNLLR